MLYLDHHATTPCAPEVVATMLPYFTEHFGNASNKSHKIGRDAALAIEMARRQVATLLLADARDLTFTSGATEAINLALRGLVAAYPERKRLLVSAFEHSAVLETAHALAHEKSLELTLVPCDAHGVVTPENLETALSGRPALAVAIMAVQNELGTIQPIADLAAIAKRHHAFFVCDAVQAIGRIPFSPAELGVDLAAMSAHKLYGPKGVGALWTRSTRAGGPTIVPITTGGGQERGLRPGTMNTPAIVGFGAAADLASQCMSQDAIHLDALRHTLLDALVSQLAHRGVPAHLMQVTGGDTPARVPGSLHLTFAGLEGFRLLSLLNTDLAVSAGSACSSERRESSHVLDAIGLPDDRRFAALRIGLGRGQTDADMIFAAARIADAVARV